MIGARARLGMTQEQLAKAAGLSRGVIAQAESLRTPLDEEKRIAIQTALERRGIVFTNGDKPGFYFDKDKADIPH